MRLAHSIVGLLLLLQGTATVTLWTLNPTDATSQAAFATLLGIDLLALAMVSYLYRMEKSGAGFSRPWLLVGCGIFVLLLVAVLIRA